MTPYSSKWSKAFAADLGERVFSTFLGALLGALTIVTATPVDWTDGKAMWAILGVPTAVSLIKGLLANLADGESGASLLPAPPGPEVNEPQPADTRSAYDDSVDGHGSGPASF